MDLDPPTMGFLGGVVLLALGIGWPLFWHHFDSQRADNE